MFHFWNPGFHPAAIHFPEKWSDLFPGIPALARLPTSAPLLPPHSAEREEFTFPLPLAVDFWSVGELGERTTNTETGVEVFVYLPHAHFDSSESRAVLVSRKKGLTSVR